MKCLLPVPGKPPRSVDFSYCLNVHPGESLEDLRRVLCTDVPQIRRALVPEADTPFGLGLRIAREAATALKDPAALGGLRTQLAEHQLYAFTVNAFPFGAFHRTRVKENVYHPDWRAPERAAYTEDVFRILADLLPPGTDGSVSTVPLSYGAQALSATDRAQMRRHFFQLARTLAEIQAEGGTLLHLGLEPEPDCTLETTHQTCAWFEDQLFLHAAREWAAEDGIPAGRAEALLRRHIGVCFDTCHVAMQFEDPADALRAYGRAGIRISKVQLSAALETGPADTPPEHLRDFDDGVYLHQCKSANGQSWPDLPQRLADPHPYTHPLRIHCHVPLHWPGDERRQTTRHTLRPEFFTALAESDCPHIEVETYTFHVLPAAIRDASLPENIIHECRWALNQLRHDGTETLRPQDGQS